MSKNVRWITETAVMLALLIALQALTKPLGQLVTGSCVNAVLAISVLLAGLGSGITIAVSSPVLAFLLGIGPAFFPLTPIIALANAGYVLLLWRFARGGRWKSLPGMIVASGAKFACLYLLVVQVVCRFMALKPQQVATFTKMFSFPQLITALIGCAVAWVVAPLVKKAISH